MTPPPGALVLRGRRIPLPPSAGLAGVAGPPRSLAEHVAPFLGWLLAVRGRRPQTAEQYRRDLRQFVVFCEATGRPMPADVDFRTVEAYCGWLQSPQRGLKATSAAQHFHAIRTFCLYLTREGFMARNATAEAFGPKVIRALPRGYLSLDEQRAVLEAMRENRTLTGRRNYALVAFALMTGARCEEMATLPLAHVHLDAGRVLIHGKGAKDREVPLIPPLVTILRAYVTETRPVLLAGTASPFLFVRTRREYHGRPRRSPSHVLTVGAARNGVRAGLPLDRRSIWALLDSHVSQLVGRHISPHMLRHSFATGLRTQGADLQEVQQLLGHACITTTTVYSHLVTIKQRDTLARYFAWADPDRG